MLKLRIILLAGALAVATVPAVAVDLPDYGSKNFSPSGDTPSYFANEAAPVAARTADTTPRDWSAVDEIAPARPTYGGTRSAHAHSGRHGRYGIAQRSGQHGAAGYGGKTASTRSSGANSARTTTAKHGKLGGRHASAGGGHYTVN